MKGITITITEAERLHIRQALRIAIEDGSLYGGDCGDTVEDREAQAIVNARHESIIAKLERRSK